MAPRHSLLPHDPARHYGAGSVVRDWSYAIQITLGMAVVLCLILGFLILVEVFLRSGPLLAVSFWMDVFLAFYLLIWWFVIVCIAINDDVENGRGANASHPYKGFIFYVLLFIFVMVEVALLLYMQIRDAGQRICCF